MSSPASIPNGNGRLAAAAERPAVASERGLMRNNLPAVYQDSDFGMRFVGALETLLDPIVGLLDAMPSHFDPKLAPDDLLELMSAWMGVEGLERNPREAKQNLLASAGELARRRGTAKGMELALKLTFPDKPLRVEDQGGVGYSLDPNEIPPAKSSDFVVYCDAPLKEDEMLLVARTIDHYKPVHSRYRLRVKAARKSS